MKSTKWMILAALVAGSLLPLAPALRAAGTNAPPVLPPAAGQHPPGAGMKPPGLDQISRQLKLTDDQKAKVKPIIEARDKKLAEMTSDTTLSREERRARFQSIRDETTAQMKPILTPEQFEKWQMTQRMHRPGGPPPPAAHSSGTNAPVVPPK